MLEFWFFAFALIIGPALCAIGMLSIAAARKLLAQHGIN